MHFFIQAIAGFLLLILAIGLAMIFRLENRADKIMVTQFLATVSIGWLLLMGLLTDSTYLFDVGLLFALLATLATIAFVRHDSARREETADDKHS